MQNNSELAASTLKTARFIFFGIGIQATLFTLWGQQFFVSLETPPTGGAIVYALFGFMAIASFAFGFRFYPNYTKHRRSEIVKHEGKKLKETLLLITAIHMLMLEFVSIVGILLAIFVQQKYIVYPFFGLFLGGMALSYPKLDWYLPFFKDSDGSAKI